jgi:hypothetical protein
VIRTDVRMEQISPIRTDFFYFLLETKHWGLKKSVRIGEICSIRTSIRITTESQISFVEINYQKLSLNCVNLKN